MTTNSRTVALSTLLKCEKSGQYSNIALDHALDASGLDDSDRALAAILVYGVMERKITLDYYISKLSSRPLGEIEPIVLNAIRMGIYQLAYLDRIPPHAAINESVSLCTGKTRGFANAILRSFMRESNSIDLPDRGDTVKYLSVKYSAGESLCHKFLSVFGEERCEALLSAFGNIPPLTLRVNTEKTSRNELLVHLGRNAHPTPISPFGIICTGRVRELYGFNDGLFFVQDEASQICTCALDAMEGDTVIDVCSCPGSKSFGAALHMKNRGKIFAFDLHGNKLSLVTSSAKRLGIDIIETGIRDGRSFDASLENIADKVICDVPCSGFGVLAKKPELRYKNPDDCRDLPQIQYDILSNSARYVKRGGIIVYSTCTLLPVENQNNVRRFLDANDDFTPEPFTVGKLSCDGMITLAPDIHGTDGFFIAKLRRIK